MKEFENLVAQDCNIVTNKGKTLKATERYFVGWDGEGMNLRGAGKPQSYVLFGCSHEPPIVSETHIPILRTLQHVIDVGSKHPNAIHVAFAFDYDVNMILQGLPSPRLQKLRNKGSITFKTKDGSTYVLSYIPRKWFSITKRRPSYNRRTNPHARTTVRIYDIFSFFNTSFIRAVEDLLGPVDETVKEGKAQRGTFTNLEYVRKYWEAEIALLPKLADALRDNLYNAGMKITQWHGPGALASYAMKQRGIKQHMGESNRAVREAARYAYAGGRFELFKVGRIQGPVYSIDINSAYPAAIAELPSMSEGEWVYEAYPRSIVEFGVYHVRLNKLQTKMPSPLFHRDAQHNITYPWCVDGWYWSPEIEQLKSVMPNIEIIEGWHYLGAMSKPFAWIHEMYDQRLQWKREGISSQMALKLCMNSLYGKMAQRVGYDAQTKRIPSWHQLEWAGWVTAKTRATLFDIMKRIPWKDLVAVETDGIYTTAHPDSLGIEPSANLGSWSIDTYDSLMYLQSGLSWAQQGREPYVSKYRGLDADSVSAFDATHYLLGLEPNKVWKPYRGRTTRFIGMGAALMRSGEFKDNHCVWETANRDVHIGNRGKRVHAPKLCEACRNGNNAYYQPHDLIIRSRSMREPISVAHSIPWENDDDDNAEWRQYANATADLIADV